MNRPAKHSEAAFLDAAATLFADGGIEAVTMAQIARAAGAPSGSLYHRFTDRPTLLYRLWRSREDEFEAVFEQLTRDIGSANDALASVVGVVDWCQEHLASAIVLQAGPRGLLSVAWPEASQHEQRRARHRQGDRLAGLTTAIGTRINQPADEVAFALLEVPLAAVRPHLLARREPPASARDLAVRVAGRILRT